MTQLAKKIGAVEFELRRSRGLTLREAAQKLGITHVHLCNIENGFANLSLDLLERMNAFYGQDLYILARARK